MEEQKDYQVVRAEQPVVTQKELDDYLFGSGTKLNEQQKKMFFAVSLLNNLNPFKREVYPIAYGDKFSLVTGYEVYLKRAERSGLLDGWEADYTKSPDGDYAFCTIYRKDRSHPITQRVWLSEYNLQNRMWKEKPKAMLIKVAIATAFRRAFPEELGGMPYTADEMPIDGEVVVESKPSNYDKLKSDFNAKPAPKPVPANEEVTLRDRVLAAVKDHAELSGLSEAMIIANFSTYTKDNKDYVASSIDHLMKSEKWAQVTLAKIKDDIKGIKEARGNADSSV
jgi:phage recombination protein Bet